MPNKTAEQKEKVSIIAEIALFGGALSVHESNRDNPHRLQGKKNSDNQVLIQNDLIVSVNIH
jgi:hypothetical protein